MRLFLLAGRLVLRLAGCGGSAGQDGLRDTPVPAGAGVWAFRVQLTAGRVEKMEWSPERGRQGEAQTGPPSASLSTLLELVGQIVHLFIKWIYCARPVLGSEAPVVTNTNISNNNNNK